MLKEATTLRRPPGADRWSTRKKSWSSGGGTGVSGLTNEAPRVAPAPRMTSVLRSLSPSEGMSTRSHAIHDPVLDMYSGGMSTREWSSRCSRRTSSTAASAGSNDEAEPPHARSGASRQQPTTCSSSTTTGSAQRPPERALAQPRPDPASVQSRTSAPSLIFYPTATTRSRVAARASDCAETRLSRRSHLPYGPRMAGERSGDNPYLPVDPGPDASSYAKQLFTVDPLRGRAWRRAVPDPGLPRCGRGPGGEAGHPAWPRQPERPGIRPRHPGRTAAEDGGLPARRPGSAEGLELRRGSDLSAELEALAATEINRPTSA